MSLPRTQTLYESTVICKFSINIPITHMSMTMLKPFFLFMHVVFLLGLQNGYPFAASFVQLGNETDHVALLAFKAAITSDPFGALNSWNESTHFCQWVGVTCGRRHQRVTVLELDHQKLGGSLSPHIGNLSFLREIWLRNSSLSNAIPPELGRLRRLQKMSLLNNTITGEIPANITGCSNLVGLELAGNKLAGEIPPDLGSLTLLKELYIGDNYLTGGVPSTFGNLSSLTFFLAWNNRISGNIPDALSQLKKLEGLTLGANNLVGTIPSSIFNISSIKFINVGANRIQGSLPSELGNTLPNLEYLGVGSNLLTGSIPISLSNATKLSYFSASTNKLTGKVPPLEKLNVIEMLVLHSNHLGTGEVDDLSFFDSLINATFLSILDIGNNNLGGVLPESIGNFSTNFYWLNVFSNNIIGKIPTGIGNLVNLQVLALSNNHLSGNIPADIGTVQKLQMLGLEVNKLQVFKGVLDEGGKVVAVKVFNLRFHGASKSFIAECKALKSIKHRNLVKILTACSSIDYQVDYLHHHCSERIVHCDLKPTNVLLDDEMIAHVGDFGLARFLLEATSSSSANQSSSIGVRGSIGYTAPEYGIGNKVSTFGDVYSYGILLLEMFTGKRPTDSMFTDTLSLHNFSKMALHESLESILDPTLLPQGQMGEANKSISSVDNQSSLSHNKIHQCLISLLQIGIACSEEQPTDRPDMNVVVTRLHKIKDTLLGSGVRGGRRSRIAA